MSQKDLEFTPHSNRVRLRASYVPVRANEEGTPRSAAFKKAEIPVGSSECAFSFLVSGGLARELLPPPRPGLQCGPDIVLAATTCRSISTFVVRNWYSDDARRFQPVDE